MTSFERKAIRFGYGTSIVSAIVAALANRYDMAAFQIGWAVLLKLWLLEGGRKKERRPDPFEEPFGEVGARSGRDFNRGGE